MEELFDYSIARFYYFYEGEEVSFYKWKNSSSGSILCDRKYWVVINEHEEYFLTNKEVMFESLNPKDKLAFAFHANEFDDFLVLGRFFGIKHYIGKKHLS